VLLITDDGVDGGGDRWRKRHPVEDSRWRPLE